MRFNLKEREAVLVKVNPRDEKHGQDPKVATDLRLKFMLPSEELNQFGKGLEDFVYTEAKKGQTHISGHATEIRFPCISYPIKMADDVIGAKVTVHRGIDAKSDLEVDGAILKNFEVEPLQGGSVMVTLTASFYPDPKQEKKLGKLCLLTGQKIAVTVDSPTETEQRKQRDLLEDPEDDDQGGDDKK
jgi:hypothetical protein